MNNNASLILSLTLLVASSLLNAEVLEMPMAVEPAEAEATTQPMEEATPPMPMEAAPTTLPGRGMTMEQVEARFGAPSEKIERVGDPPISRWVYGSFTVYFEYDKVIHAVTHKN